MRADLAMAPIVGTSSGLPETAGAGDPGHFGRVDLHPRGQDVFAAQRQHAALEIDDAAPTQVLLIIHKCTSSMEVSACFARC